MGTSASKNDPPSGTPLIPPWAQDPTDTGDQNADTNGNGDGKPAVPPPNVPLAPPRRFNAFRRDLRQYVITGDQAHAKAALGHWVNTSRGGASAGAQRMSRAARSGGGAIAAFARGVSGESAAAGQLDVRSLAGLPSEIAIDRIVDEFCPPGILDEEALRAAIGEALASALEGVDTFDLAALDQNAVRIAILRFVAELVFVSVVMDSGETLSAVSPTVAIQRENSLRSLIREVTDVVGTPLLNWAGAVLNAASVDQLVSRLVAEVHAEMAKWA